MCGHGLIGVATTLVELGYIIKNNGSNTILFDTSEGIVEAKVSIDNGNILQVTIRNVPSFVYEENIQLHTPIGDVQGDVVYGGNWFYIIDGEKLGIMIDRSNLDQLISISVELLRVLRDEESIQLPRLTEEEKKVDHIKIFKHISSHGSKSFVMCPGRAYDRSPCGTGLSAEMALLNKKGSLSLGQSYFGESIIGSRFEGRLIANTTIGKYQGVVPEISGKAYITSINQYVIDELDPYKAGF